MGKFCNECLTFKEDYDFKKQHNRADGLSVRCLVCIKTGKPNKTSPRIEPPDSKVCSRCNREWPIDHFKKGNSLDGYIGICKYCFQKSAPKKAISNAITSVILDSGKKISVKKFKERMRK